LAVPPSSFVTGSDVAKGKLLLGRALVDLKAPAHHCLMWRWRHDLNPFCQRSGAFRSQRRIKKVEKERRKGPAQGPKTT
jgi:hypothetical protein